MVKAVETLAYAEVEGWARVPAEMAPERDATSVAISAGTRHLAVHHDVRDLDAPAPPQHAVDLLITATLSGVS